MKALSAVGRGSAVGALALPNATRLKVGSDGSGTVSDLDSMTH